MIDKVLNNVTNVFIKNDIMYGIGGSYMLDRCYFKTKVNDIDIFIAKKDLTKTFNVMKLYDKLSSNAVVNIKSLYHQRYLINDIQIDLMADMYICHHQQWFLYSLHDQEQLQNINGKDYMYIEDWYYIYWLLNRKDKVKLIREHWLKSRDIDHSRIANLIKIGPELFYQQNKILFDKML